MLACELIVVHLLFLDLYETFLPCFLLENVNPMTIYFNSAKYYLSTIKIKLENWEDIQCQDNLAPIDCVINMTIESIVFIKIIDNCLTYYKCKFFIIPKHEPDIKY